MSDPNTIDAVVVREQNNAVARAQDNAMSVADIIAQVRLIQDVMGKVMTEGEHFGVIPGTGTRKTLLQPGAQKLCMTFRLAPEYVIQESPLERGHKEYRIICTLKSISSGAFVGQGVGVCSTMEGKYRFRGGARKCPECGKEAIIKGKAEYGGGWLCFAKKGGCGEKWPDGAAEIEGQSVDKVEHDNPADFFNTVLKMAKKRAFVDATITATAASDIFTQDIADPEEDSATPEPPKRPVERPAPARPSTSVPAPKAAQAAREAAEPPAPAKQGTEEEWAKFLGACKARLLMLIKPEDEWAWWYYAVQQSWILPAGEHLGDATESKVFEGFNRANFKESAKAIMQKHATAVDAIMASCAPEFKEETERGMERMPRTPDPEKKPEGASKTRKAGKPNSCPACSSTAAKKHEHLIDHSWCQTCGVMWENNNTFKLVEEREWMWAKLPFAPKDEAKKSYKGMTLGQLSRLDSKYWFGIVMNFEAKPFQGRPPSAESVKFAEACEAARKHLQEENTEKEAQDADGPPQDDDIPM
jgi:hypothetical protein